MYTFALMVLGGPISSQGAETAYAFASAAVGARHRVSRVFFFHDGVLCGNQAMQATTAEPLATRWAGLAAAHEMELVLCASSARKRGVTDAAQAARSGREAAWAVAPAPFLLGGLGEWVEACLQADRVVTFGP